MISAAIKARLKGKKRLNQSDNPSVVADRVRLKVTMSEGLPLVWGRVLDKKMMRARGLTRERKETPEELTAQTIVWK